MPDPTDKEKEELIERASEEVRRLGDQLDIELHLGLSSAMYLVAQLQLAMRHPGNTGEAPEIARGFIDGVIQIMARGGYPATAEVARAGDDPKHDVPATRNKPAGGMVYSPEMRERMIKEIAGKTVAHLEYSEAEGESDPIGAYWTITFTDDSEFSFRFMAELVNQ